MFHVFFRWQEFVAFATNQQTLRPDFGVSILLERTEQNGRGIFIWALE
jgi:hypothetical protein